MDEYVSLATDMERGGAASRCIIGEYASLAADMERGWAASGCMKLYRLNHTVKLKTLHTLL